MPRNFKDLRPTNVDRAIGNVQQVGRREDGKEGKNRSLRTLSVRNRGTVGRESAVAVRKIAEIGGAERLQ